MAVARVQAPFKVGKKEHYIPSFTVALCRTAALPAIFAKFHVPLWFSKLDLRDYLFHGYNVRILNVRSYVKQSRVQQGRNTVGKPQPRRWFRPRAQKFMTVQLESPFVWPPEPEDFSPWNKKETEDAEKEQEKVFRPLASDGDTIISEDRRVAMREQAQELLEGRKRWVPPRNRTFDMSLGR